MQKSTAKCSKIAAMKKGVRFIFCLGVNHDPAAANLAHIIHGHNCYCRPFGETVITEKYCKTPRGLGKVAKGLRICAVQTTAKSGPPAQL
jgi:hypothetical protein